MIVECEFCYNIFLRPACHVARVKKVFCSRRCHDYYQNKQLFKRCKICKTIFAVRRCKKSQFSTCSNRDCRKLNKCKINNGNWRGGITKSRKSEMSTIAYKQWRLSVFERDNYTCCICRNRGGELNADHIKPWAYFPQLRYDVLNGRTLCVKCHRTTFKDNLKWRNNLILQ
jgi:hypothetical protein